MEIIDDRLYKISEIVKNGLIKNTKNQSTYLHIYKLVKSGTLKVQNKSTNPSKLRPVWMITGAEIRRYKREVEGIEI